MTEKWGQIQGKWKLVQISRGVRVILVRVSLSEYHQKTKQSYFPRKDELLERNKTCLARWCLLSFKWYCTKWPGNLGSWHSNPKCSTVFNRGTSHELIQTIYELITEGVYSPTTKSWDTRLSGGVQGGLNLPSSVPFAPTSRTFYYHLPPLSIAVLRNYASRPLLLPLPTRFLLGSRLPVSLWTS